MIPIPPAWIADQNAFERRLTAARAEERTALLARVERLKAALAKAEDYLSRLPQFPDRGVDIPAVLAEIRAALAEKECK